MFPAFREYLRSSPGDEEQKKAAFIQELKKIDDYLTATGGPLFGEHDLNATDASIAPKLYHALTALNHYKGFDIHAASNEWLAIKAYGNAIKQKAAWTNTNYGTAAIIQGWATPH
eukprot:jgi/Chrzof1/6132/Cz17g12020.t1